MRRRAKSDDEKQADLRHFEKMFVDDKREAEVRLALIRIRINTLERVLATKEKLWTPGK